MHPVVKAQLKDFSDTHSNEKFSESEFFEVYSIHSIENGLMGLNINPFDAHLEGKEFGIDGVSIVVQGELCNDTDQVAAALEVGKNHEIEFHFFQSKMSRQVAYGELSKFLDAVVDFFAEGELAQSPQIDDLRNCKDLVYSSASNKNPSIRCFFCTTGTGEVSAAIRKVVDANHDRMKEMSMFSEIDIEIIGAKRLQDSYRSATNAISASFEFPSAITLPRHPAVDEAFIGVVSATELLKLAVLSGDDGIEDRINRAVFYDNVRDFNPNSEINHVVLQELKNGMEQSFVFKNNGVTIVAKEIKRKSDTFILDDYQIVNGCQTTNTLFLARNAVQGVNVPIRLIGSKDADFVSNIIIGTNQQNQVREDQFWALLPFMKDLEEFSKSQLEEKKILIERRENQYRDVKVEKTRICKPAELMKAVAATYLERPNLAARNYRRVRKEFGNQVFQSTHNVELYHLVAMCNYKFDFAVRNKRVNRSNVIYKYYSLFAVFKNFWNGPNLLNATKKDQAKVIREIHILLDDEDRWVNLIKKVSRFLDEKVSNRKLETREQIRDYIRTDGALSSFKEEFLISNNL